VRPALHSAFMQILAPLLAPGEQVQVAAICNIGTVSVKRKVAMAMAVGIASGGTMIATVNPRPMFMALTDRRVLIVNSRKRAGSGAVEPTQLWAHFPRAAVSSSPPKAVMLGLAKRAIWTVNGWQQGLKVTFPYISRHEGRAILDSLPRT
jgi:hypothetical protein